jgi:ribonuclease P protein component
MKKNNRLLKNYDFKKVLDTKRSFASKEFVVYVKNNDLNHIRVGISVSSKLGNSVIRHKIKRQINEMLKDIVTINQNNDIVIIVRNKYTENDFLKNKESLKKILSKF